VTEARQSFQLQSPSRRNCCSSTHISDRASAEALPVCHSRGSVKARSQVR